jgi:hypothetical protein
MVPSGYVNIANWNMAHRKFVSFPMKNMVIFQFVFWDCLPEGIRLSWATHAINNYHLGMAKRPNKPPLNNGDFTMSDITRKDALYLGRFFSLT